jgi:pyruvate kinase
MMRPAVVDGVAAGMRLFDEEQFGPIVALARYREVGEALAWQERSPYGQQAGVWGPSGETRDALVAALTREVARVNINAPCQRGPDSFGFTATEKSGSGTLSIDKALESLSRVSIISSQESAAIQQPEPDQVARVLGPPRPGRRTRIVCTVGPASSTVPVLTQMIEAGMDVARINFSHVGSPIDAERLVSALRAAMKAAGRPVQILGDLQGPKLRVAALDAPLSLIAGSTLTLCTDQQSAPGRLPLAPAGIVADIQVGQAVFIDDGKVELVVVHKEDGRLEAEVLKGGVVSSKKGVNLPGTQLSMALPTDKDRADLATMKRLGVDLVAASFVESAEDITKVRRAYDAPVRVVAKIERRKAVERIREILEVSDGVMVARGDGAVELGDAAMPVIQNQIHRLGNQRGKVTGTATQMMESLIHGGDRPSRSDASDVARAAMEGSDFVMTSAETAVGSDPVKVIQVMSRILEQTEAALRDGTVR